MTLPNLYGSSETWLFREVVAQCFRPDGANAAERLRTLPAAAWQRHLRWLDASGMSLYLHARLIELDALDVLPPPIRSRLEHNLADNQLRTASLFADMIEISRDFEASGVCFANQKGLALPVDSVPCSHLRCQIDLDFLVAHQHARLARKVLERKGYRLHAISGDTMEFSTPAAHLPSMDDLYKPKPQRSVELHLVTQTDLPAANRLARATTTRIRGLDVRAVSPADHLLLQALHLFKHLRSDFTRMSWLLEFSRHVTARHDDSAFWDKLRYLASESPEAPIAMGAACLLAETLFKAETPASLRSSTVDTLPPVIALWTETYGRRAALSEIPGTKLYLLLEPELEACGLRTKSAASQRLVPFHLPRMIVHGSPGDSIGTHLTRYAQQAKYLLYRTRFHIREGIRYNSERSRWAARKRTPPC